MNFDDNESPATATPYDGSLSDASASSISNAFIEENKITESNNFYAKLQRCRYQCGICAEIVSDRRLYIHHGQKHSSVPFSPDIYELYEINERAQCNLCNQQMDPQKIINHQRQKHPNIFQTDAIEPTNSSHCTFPGTLNPYQLTFQDPLSPLASASLLQRSNHDQAAYMNQHYVNVFISETEYQRLALDGRVYSDQSGQIFIPDSM